MQSSDKWRSEDKDACEMQVSLAEAHQNAFNNVCAIVEADILNNGKVMKLSTLNDKYKSSLNMSTHYNPHYHNENLKKKLLKRFSDQLVFIEMKATCPYQSAIVFSAALDVKSAIRESFLLGSVDTIQNIGTTLHHMIAESHNKSPDLKWPPVPDDLEEPDMPDALNKLCLL